MTFLDLIFANRIASCKGALASSRFLNFNDSLTPPAITMVSHGPDRAIALAICSNVAPDFASMTMSGITFWSPLEILFVFDAPNILILVR